MEIVATLPGGKRVDAQVGRFIIRTDQPVESGGDGSAPDPFTLFLASLATCAGFYVAAYCQARKISTEGIRVIERADSDPETKRLVRVSIELELPPGFPAAHRDGVIRAVASCKVKKTLAAPPDIEVRAA